MMPPPPIVDIPLFAGLSDAAKVEVQSTCALREYGAGDVILKPGAIGEFLYAIAIGAVSVKPAASQPAFVLGPSEVFGEMSLLSHSPVSAGVIAERESRIYLITARTFDKLFADEPSFRKGISDLLARRLRLRTSHKESTPTCVLVGLPSVPSALPRALVRAVDYYAHVAETRLVAFDQDIEAIGSEIDTWRASAHLSEVCVAALPARRITELRIHTRPGDAVLLVDDGTPLSGPALPGDWKIDIATVRVGCAVRRPASANEVWSYRLEDAEIAAAEIATDWSPRTAPVLDSIARWIARRTIGIALGAGSARGFAHIGVLSVLDAAGVPIDCLSGSSIGGIIALAYAMSGSADGAYDLARSTLGSNEMIRDVSFFPRTALLRGRKVRRSADRVSAGRYFPDLTRPALVVTADLITGQRIVLDSGLVASAFIATAAIPGVLPPVKTSEHWLVDGALVSRVPVDLLGRWRCGLKIAVNVVIDPKAEGSDLHADLRRAMNGPFGLGRVITRSWELLGVSHGTAEAQAADIVIRPRTHLLSGGDFGAISAFVAAGSAAAEQELPGILDAVDKLLRRRPR
jgi:NTE family protein